MTKTEQALARWFPNVRVEIAALPQRAARNAEYSDLAGEDSAADYAEAQRALGALIAEAKHAHAALTALRHHRHDWNEDDYCNVCGADGRA